MAAVKIRSSSASTTRRVRPRSPSPLAARPHPVDRETHPVDSGIDQIAKRQMCIKRQSEHVCRERTGSEIVWEQTRPSANSLCWSVPTVDVEGCPEPTQLAVKLLALWPVGRIHKLSLDTRQLGGNQCFEG